MPLYVKMFRGDFILSRIGEQVIGHETAEQGGYSVHFVGSSLDFQKIALHVRQGRFGIVYQREGNGLLRPSVYENIDEFEFLPFIAKQFGIPTKVQTQDAGATLYERGTALSKKGKWEEALKCLIRLYCTWPVKGRPIHCLRKVSRYIT